MLKDITLGQYFPKDSIIHKLDPRFKIVITVIYIALLFATDSFIGLMLGTIFALIVWFMTKIPIKLMWKSLKPIMPIIVITAILNLFMIEGDKILWSWGFLEITDKSLHECIFNLVRIIMLIVGSSILTYTTSPVSLTDGIERLFSPLKRLNVPVHELAMMMTIALRFIPLLIDETDKIISAQKSRGASFETGSLKDRISAVIPVLIPLFVSAFRRSEELALAMECRCYNGGEGRTRLKQLKATPRDYVALGLSTSLLVINIVVF
ncbi:MAG: energy-coupling factor transporter transmembrane component T family protein [Oscillospiraceae bacterium]